MAPTLVTSCTALPPKGAAAPADWQSQIRGPGLKRQPPRLLASRSALLPLEVAAPADWQSQIRRPGLKGYPLAIEVPAMNLTKIEFHD